MARSNGNTLFFTYDPQGYPAAFNWNGSNYYYVTNLQGDVIAILDGSKTMVVEYSYDAWGKILAIGGSMASTLGTLNPLTYRGYVYDHETGLYYLQSRYYNPEWGRFLNADALVSTGQGMLGNNMFTYCNNTPVACADPSGTITAVCYGNGIDLISMPWQDVGPGGGYRNTERYSSIYTQTDGLILDQENYMYSNKSFGWGSIAESGCAPIAIYNAMWLLGVPQSLGHICDEFLYKHGTLLFGKWGVAPWQLEKYFSAHEISYTGFSSSFQLENAVSSGDVIVFTLMNNVQQPGKGFHTMAALYTGGRFVVYNGYDGGYTSVQHLYELGALRGWVYGYIVER